MLALVVAKAGVFRVFLLGRLLLRRVRSSSLAAVAVAPGKARLVEQAAGSPDGLAEMVLFPAAAVEPSWL